MCWWIGDIGCVSGDGDSVVSASMMTESQTVNLLSVSLLCQLCQHTDEMLHTECVLADLIKLIDCDDEERWNCMRAFDVHLVSETKCFSIVVCFNIEIIFCFDVLFYNRLILPSLISLALTLLVGCGEGNPAGKNLILSISDGSLA